MFRNALKFITIAYLSSQVIATIFTPFNANPTCNGRSSGAKYIKLITPSEIPDQCSYKIQKHNPHICQLLVKFKEYKTPQPETETSVDGTLTKKCIEFLDINGMVICGNNDGQHLYIPMDSEVVFQFHGNKQSSWNIQITQLECSPNFFPFPSNDLNLVAPSKCNQYFTESKGVIQSFNFNDGLGVYPSNLNYAICIKRPSVNSSLKLQFNKFALGGGLDSVNLPDFNTICNQMFQASGISSDYLMLPPGMVIVSSPDINVNFFCGNSLNGLTVIGDPVGPITLIFNSDNLYDSTNEIGFQIDYSFV